MEEAFSHFLPPSLRFSDPQKSLVDSDFELLRQSQPRNAHQDLVFRVSLDRRQRYKIRHYDGGLRWYSGTKLQERTRDFHADSTIYAHPSTLLGFVRQMLSEVSLSPDLDTDLAERLIAFAMDGVVRYPDCVGVKLTLTVREVYMVGMDDYLRARAERIELEDALTASADDTRMVPASSSAIQGLETITYDGSGSGSGSGSSTSSTATCAVCLDDFNQGCALTKMPCSHLFHGDCITTWLQNSHFCPVCRFKLPNQA